MKILKLTPRQWQERYTQGLTLTEVVISMAIVTMMTSSLITGHVLSARNAEWSSYSLAGQALALQGIEQARAAKWDVERIPPVDECISGRFPPQANIIDVAGVGTTRVWATNYFTITTPTAGLNLKLIRVDCVWAYRSGRWYTNTVITYRAPET